MGLIHSRAAKKRNKAEAKLLKEQRKGLRQDRHDTQAEAAAEPDEGKPWYRQPTLGAALKARQSRQDG